MPKILSRDDVVKVAHLARIKLKDSEIDNFVKEINEILKYVNQLQKTDVSGLKPTDQVTGLTNVWRQDELIDYHYPASSMMNNVPKSEDNYIQVNRVI